MHMHMHAIFALFSLRVVLASGLRLGISCKDTEVLVGRGAPGVPRLRALPRLGCASHSSRLVARGDDVDEWLASLHGLHEKSPKSPESPNSSPRSSSWDPFIFSSHAPASPHAPSSFPGPSTSHMNSAEWSPFFSGPPKPFPSSPPKASISYPGPSSSHEPSGSLEPPLKRLKLMSMPPWVPEPWPRRQNPSSSARPLSPPSRPSRTREPTRLSSFEQPGSESSSKEDSAGSPNRNRVPLNPGRLNVPSESRPASMYQVVTPDPYASEGVRHYRTGELTFFRRILDDNEGPPDWDKKIRSLNYVDPSYVMAKSEGQRATYLTHSRPGQYQVMKTLGIGGVRDAAQGAKGKWQMITLKKQHELPTAVTTPWSLAQLKESLQKQDQHFKNHEVSQWDTKYARLDRDMRAMCNTVRCSEKQMKMIFGNHSPRYLR